MSEMFSGLKCRTLLGWFLILWGVTFFFGSIYGFLDVAGGGYSADFLVINVLWSLVELPLFGILVVLGIKVLRGECFKT